MPYTPYVDFSELKGKTIIKINVARESDEIDVRTEAGYTDHDFIEFDTDDGMRYIMYHSQDCCESVYIDDIIGSLSSLLYSPVLYAEEVTSSEDDGPSDQAQLPDGDLDYESYTWTFYRIGTQFGFVTIRWFGSSNGYYSEAVDFAIVPHPDSM